MTILKISRLDVLRLIKITFLTLGSVRIFVSEKIFVKYGETDLVKQNIQFMGIKDFNEYKISLSIAQ